jgi:uncharacterized membrane protein
MYRDCACSRWRSVHSEWQAAWLGADRSRFVGLVVPHLVRRLLGASYRVLLPMSLCVGAALLVTCDAFARLIVPGRELPVGIVTAALGAPTLVFLVGARPEISACSAGALSLCFGKAPD